MDRRLRELRRDAEAGGGPRAWLDYAHALRASGEPPHVVLNALLGGREALEVRAEIGRYPAWTHWYGDAGRTRHVDVPPLRELGDVTRVPFELGASTLEVEQPLFPILLLASPLGIFCRTRAGHTGVRDPQTGALRWELSHDEWDPTRAPRPTLLGEVLLLPERGEDGGAQVAARDLWTGEELHRTPLPGAWFMPPLDGLLLTLADERVLARQVSNPRCPPELVWEADPPASVGLTEDWRFDAGTGPTAGMLLTIGAEGTTCTGVVSSAETVFVRTDDGLHAWDRATGAAEEQTTWGLPMADGAGSFQRSLSNRNLVCRDLAGEPLWTSDSGLPLLLAPTFVVAETRTLQVFETLQVFARETGEVLSSHGLLMDKGCLAAARDVLYDYNWLLDPDDFSEGPQSSLRATTPEGELLWEHAPDQDLFALAPLPGALCALDREGGLVLFSGA